MQFPDALSKIQELHRSFLLQMFVAKDRGGTRGMVKNWGMASGGGGMEGSMLWGSFATYTATCSYAMGM